MIEVFGSPKKESAQAQVAINSRKRSRLVKYFTVISGFLILWFYI